MPGSGYRTGVFQSLVNACGATAVVAAAATVVKNERLFIGYSFLGFV